MVEIQLGSFDSKYLIKASPSPYTIRLNFGLFVYFWEKVYRTTVLDNYSCGVHGSMITLYDDPDRHVGIIDYWCFTLDLQCNVSIFFEKDELVTNRLEQTKGSRTLFYLVFCAQKISKKCLFQMTII